LQLVYERTLKGLKEWLMVTGILITLD